MDVGLCTPSPIIKYPEAELEHTSNRSAVHVADMQASAACEPCSNDAVLEMLTNLERRLEKLDANASKPAVGELKWALAASTFSSILFATSTMYLARIDAH